MLSITPREAAYRMFEDIDSATIGGQRPSRQINHFPEST
jgi:hypothetical protein